MPCVAHATPTVHTQHMIQPALSRIIDLTTAQLHTSMHGTAGYLAVTLHYQQPHAGLLVRKACLFQNILRHLCGLPAAGGALYDNHLALLQRLQKGRPPL